MSARDCFPVAAYFTRKKLISGKVNVFLFAGFLALLAFIWFKGTFIFSCRLFLFLFPHLFLFLAQDMIKDEVDSGALENLLFIDGKFRAYLGWKNAIIAAAAFGAGVIVFLSFSFYGLATHQFTIAFLLQFATGILAGLYYLALAGFLSTFLKAGTNVLLVILGQVLLLFGVLIAASQSPGWIERFTSSSFSLFTAKLEFLALAAVFPNLIAARRSWPLILELSLLAGLFFGLQLLRIRSLELRK